MKTLDEMLSLRLISREQHAEIGSWIAEARTPQAIMRMPAPLWRALELARARKLLAKGEDVDAVLEALSKGLTQKMLHGAMAELRTADAQARERASNAIQHFFLRSDR